MNKKIIFLGAVIVVAAFIVSLGTSRNDMPRTISVTGECLTTAPRDRTAITLRVTTLDKSAATSMRRASAQIAAITEYLKNMDVKMQTTRFDSFEKTEWNHAAQKSVNLGIETTIAIEVSANNIETIEKILSEFAGRENVYAENLRMFTSSETMQPIMDDCLATAVENARARANALASGDGRRAGKMLAAEYGTGMVARPTSNFMTRSAKLESAAMDMAYTAGGIVSQDTQVTVTVSAVFEIK